MNACIAQNVDESFWRAELFGRHISASTIEATLVRAAPNLAAPVSYLHTPTPVRSNDEPVRAERSV